MSSISSRPLSAQEAREFIDGADFDWYQRFQLAPGVFTPGLRDVDSVLQKMDLPAELTGKSVLDIGTTNGGLAFALEARGASRVVAVDICSASTYGVDRLQSVLGSRVEFVQASAYELPAILAEQFDIVAFLGVLYHMRHPLLALDNLRALTRGVAFVETEVADNELPACSHLPVARFYRRDERAQDSSNWFAPTIECLLDWCLSCGFEPELIAAWPDPPARCLLSMRPTNEDPEFLALSYENVLRVNVAERS